MKWRASTVKPSGRIWSHQKDVGRSQVMCFCSASWRFPNGGVAAFYHLSGVVSSPSFEWVILNSCFLSVKPFQTYILDGYIFVIWIMPLCAGQSILKKHFKSCFKICRFWVFVCLGCSCIGKHLRGFCFAPRCCISRVALVNFLICLVIVIAFQSGITIWKSCGQQIKKNNDAGKLVFRKILVCIYVYMYIYIYVHIYMYIYIYGQIIIIH